MTQKNTVGRSVTYLRAQLFVKYFGFCHVFGIGLVDGVHCEYKLHCFLFALFAIALQPSFHFTLRYPHTWIGIPKDP